MVSASYNDENPFGEVIYAYTRAQAIEDGTLVDVTETAKAVASTLGTVTLSCPLTSYTL